MQLAILGNQQLTMGTREIADMLGKNHSIIKLRAEQNRQLGKSKYRGTLLLRADYHKHAA